MIPEERRDIVVDLFSLTFSSQRISFHLRLSLSYVRHRSVSPSLDDSHCDRSALASLGSEFPHMELCYNNGYQRTSYLATPLIGLAVDRLVRCRSTALTSFRSSLIRMVRLGSQYRHENHFLPDAQ